MIAAITREVVKRLREGTASHASPLHQRGPHPNPTRERGTDVSPPSECEATHKLVTADTLKTYPDGGTVQLVTGAVVTPAARDEARSRSIQFEGGSIGREVQRSSAPPATVSVPGQSVVDDDPITQQLTRRGITLPANINVIWSITPAAEVVRRCTGGGVAVMLTRLSDIDRFAAEISPTVWVIDREQVNLVAATNMAARIARLVIAVPKSNSGSQL